MALSSALAACLVAVSTHYNVPQLRLEGMLYQQSASPSFGIANIPELWMPALRAAGFDLQAVRTQPCDNIAAAGWLLRYMADMQREQAQPITEPTPARTVHVR